MKKIIRKMSNRIGKNKGASLLMVIVTFAMLIIIGSTFSYLAYRTYMNSYGKFCTQQAYYTAESVMNTTYEKFKQDTKMQTDLINDLNNKYEVADEESRKNVAVKINVDDYKENLGKVTAQLRYADENKTELSLEVKTTYKGFEQKLRARIKKGMKAGSELKKIFDNTFYFRQPIVDILAQKINGNVYIDNPGNDASIYNNVTIGNRKWVEVYIRSWLNDDNHIAAKPTVILGDLICNTNVLIGLIDENGKVHTNEKNYDRNHFQKTDWTATHIEGDIYVNGDMEARNLIANNIYCKGNVNINGTQYEGTNASIKYRNVEIKGDVFSNGYVHLENATIYGNVFAKDNIDLINCEVKGNVYGNKINAYIKESTFWKTNSYIQIGGGIYAKNVKDSNLKVFYKEFLGHKWDPVIKKLNSHTKNGNPYGISSQNLAKLFNQRLREKKCKIRLNDSKWDLTDYLCNIKKWSAPEKAIDEKNIELGTCVYKTVATSEEQNSLIKNNEFVIDDNMIFEEMINLGENSIIKLDTSKGNLHIIFRKGLILGDKSRIVLTGGNMAFMFFENEDENFKPILKFGKNCRIGLIDNKIETEVHNDSIYFISNHAVDISSDYNLKLTGYFYMPNAVWDMEGKEFFSTKDNEYVTKGKVSTLEGAFAIKGFKISDEFLKDVIAQSYVRYRQKKAPIIVDSALNVNKDALGVSDFKEVEWEFMGYY